MQTEEKRPINKQQQSTRRSDETAEPKYEKRDKKKKEKKEKGEGEGEEQEKEKEDKEKERDECLDYLKEKFIKNFDQFGWPVNLTWNGEDVY